MIEVKWKVESNSAEEAYYEREKLDGARENNMSERVVYRINPVRPLNKKSLPMLFWILLFCPWKITVPFFVCKVLSNILHPPMELGPQN